MVYVRHCAHWQRKRGRAPGREGGAKRWWAGLLEAARTAHPNERSPISSRKLLKRRWRRQATADAVDTRREREQRSAHQRAKAERRRSVAVARRARSGDGKRRQAKSASTRREAEATEGESAMMRRGEGEGAALGNEEATRGIAAVFDLPRMACLGRCSVSVVDAGLVIYFGLIADSRYGAVAGALSLILIALVGL